MNFEEPEREEEKLEMKCTQCSEEFSDENFEKIVFLENCEHTVC